jgi:hypothetical protein
MVFDREDAGVTQRFGLDAVFDVFLEALTAVEIGAAAWRADLRRLLGDLILQA